MRKKRRKKPSYSSVDSLLGSKEGSSRKYTKLGLEMGRFQESVWERAAKERQAELEKGT